MKNITKDQIPQHTIDKLLSRRKFVNSFLDTQCWEYTGARKQYKPRPGRKIIQDHGLIRILGKPGILIQTHVLAAILWLPDYDFTKWVLHKCNNPPCFNPNHLYQGTNSDNMLDMWASGRRNRVWGKFLPHK